MITTKVVHQVHDDYKKDVFLNHIPLAKLTVKFPFSNLLKILCKILV